MASYNRVILIGNITRDIEVRYIPSGTAVCDIGLAMNRKSKDKPEEVTFVDVTLWGREAEVAGEYCRKGSPLQVEGRLTLDTWEDKQTGQKRSKLKVTGERIQLLGSKGDGTKSYQPPSQDTPQPDWQETDQPPDGDVPF